MNMRILTLSFIAVFSIFNGVANAQSNLNYYPVQESLPDGSVRFKIIEEDPSLRSQQNQISQQVIYKAIVQKADLPIDVQGILQKILKKNQADLLDNAGPTRPTTGGPRFPMVAKPLWTPVKNAWTEADEDAYSAWFAQQTTDFNQDTGLLADCADTGLLFRWVYARNNLLPIANTMTGSGKLVGHFSSNAAWDALPTNADWKQDERFKAAMRYVFDNTYTRTVVSDIYPTVISPQYVRPGSMVMIIRPADGHTQTVHQVAPTRGITTLWGNEPAAETIYSSALIIEIQNKMTVGMWRQVELVGQTWQLTPANQMPGYSTAQFAQTFNSNGEMNDWLNSQLGVVESDATRLQVLESAFEQGLGMRLQVTAESIPFCIAIQCATTSAAYDNYSTFARDAKLVSEQQEMAALITKMGTTNPDVINFENQVKEEGEVIHGSGLTYLALLQDPTLLTKFNSDPRVSYETRWGIAPATPNATLDFYTISQALSSLLSERLTEINNGFYTCQRGGCTPNSATLKSLNTATLDGGIKTVVQETLAAANVAGVDPAAITAVHTYFSNTWIYNLTATTCANNYGTCTFNDIVWGTDAATHINAWSPVATDPINTRWGY